MTVPDVHLHPTDAAELAELLQLLDGWLTSDHDKLDWLPIYSGGTATPNGLSMM
jgi:hypothetical protein